FNFKNVLTQTGRSVISAGAAHFVIKNTYQAGQWQNRQVLANAFGSALGNAIVEDRIYHTANSPQPSKITIINDGGIQLTGLDTVPTSNFELSAPPEDGDWVFENEDIGVGTVVRSAARGAAIGRARPGVAPPLPGAPVPYNPESVEGDAYRAGLPPVNFDLSFDLNSDFDWGTFSSIIGSGISNSFDDLSMSWWELNGSIDGRLDAFQTQVLNEQIVFGKSATEALSFVSENQFESPYLANKMNQLALERGLNLQYTPTYELDFSGADSLGFSSLYGEIFGASEVNFVGTPNIGLGATEYPSDRLVLPPLAFPADNGAGIPLIYTSPEQSNLLADWMPPLSVPDIVLPTTMTTPISENKPIIYLSESANNDNLGGDGQSADDFEPYTTYRARINQTPTNGSWVGGRGESKFIHNNPDVNSKLAEFGINGIEYKNGYPNFSPTTLIEYDVESIGKTRASLHSRMDTRLSKDP
ncbi:hypothetical protein, partial [Pleionea sp. CnH1-48]|uniref:hypothetical protein n=1 Tax=Pleionea sp. CnH1-48 TaxID=2954494 RepID=UPI0020971C43